MEEIKSLINRDEIRRLEKAAKDKDKRKLADWAKQLEAQINQEYEKEFKKELERQLDESIDNFILTIVYTLHFNENTKFGPKRIESFMNDLLETIDMYRRGEAIPEDYRNQLKQDKIFVKGVNE